MRLVRGLVQTGVVLFIALGCAAGLAAAEQARIVRSLDGPWRFMRGEVFNAEQVRFDDEAWRTVRVPHDWSIEGPYEEANPTRRGGGYLPSGVSWYRKTFTLPKELEGRRVFVEFDGVMANSRVWINGYHLGFRPNGYVSFRYELTDHVRFGDDARNVIAVRTDTSLQPASRWYTGQGITRHVRLVVTDPVHLVPWSLYVTSPEPGAERATVHVAAQVVNQFSAAREVRLRTAILDPDGRTVETRESESRSIAPGATVDFALDFSIARPRRWDLDDPALYRAAVQVLAGEAAIDDQTASFGIRDAHFEADTGFWLNGRNFKILGVCLHHDGGAVGAAVPLRVWERRLERLKAIGVNAIRTAHNPPAPEFLDLCDRMGFLVMDELWDAWTYSKPHANYGVQMFFREWWEADTRDTVLRDRNHPSIILWSAGNEIHDTPNAPLAKRILRGLVDVFHRYDPSRPVTQALFRPNVSHDYDNGLADLLDVVGQNYRENEILAAHEQKPSRKIIGTENSHDRRAWLALRDHPAYAGQFLWAGIDYLGEADWPRTTSASGLLDRMGEFRPRGYQRQSWWSSEPMVRMFRRVAPARRSPTDPGYEGPPANPPPRRRGPSLFGDWTPADKSPHEETVEVYSNAESVELFLNDRSLGAQPLPADASPRTWKVAYEPGTLRAVASNDGREVARHELRTAGAPARIELQTDQRELVPTWDDVANVTVRIVDEHGVLVPSADNRVSFDIAGPAELVAVDNGDNASHESYQAPERKAFQGRALAIIRAKGPGRIVVRASSPGLEDATVEITGQGRAPGS